MSLYPNPCNCDQTLDYKQVLLETLTVIDKPSKEEFDALRQKIVSLLADYEQALIEYQDDE